MFQCSHFQSSCCEASDSHMRIFNLCLWIINHVQLNIAWFTTIQMTIFINSQSVQLCRHTFNTTSCFIILCILHLTLELPTSRLSNWNCVNDKQRMRPEITKPERNGTLVYIECLRKMLLIAFAWMLNETKMKCENHHHFASFWKIKSTAYGHTFCLLSSVPLLFIIIFCYVDRMKWIGLEL